MRISDFPCFRWCHPRKPPSTGSRDAPPASQGGHAASSGPLPSVDTSQLERSTGRIPSGTARDDLISQLVHTSVMVEHSNYSNLASTPDPHGLMTQLPTHPSQSISFDPLGVPQCSRAPPTTSQQSLTSQRLLPQDRNSIIPYYLQNIHDSRNVSVDGNWNTVTYVNTVVESTNNFMKELLEKTIPGAAFDSSARDTPPRCHPGTRLGILKRCLHFIVNCSDEKKMRWVFGAAGVGKSAIMQNVAESPLSSVTLSASIFFFANGRSDGSKTIVTLAYQLAAKCGSYRQLIAYEINSDPSLLRSSISVQFKKLIIEPFIDHSELTSAGRVLLIIDGLDECDNSHTQRELLQLISDFCLTYPSSPIVWMIASRPEPHITSFFAQSSIHAAYEKEEILVDSDEVQWPSEKDFWELANGSGGLFVYAHTVIKYIGDRDIGDPISQLDEVLQVIDAHPLPNISREEHPMALLDALYSRILSKVPTKVKENMRKLLLTLVVGREHLGQKEGQNFIVLCNWLGMTSDEAYAALRHLSSVLYIPGRGEAHKEKLRYFYKSFVDYISDYSRSRFLSDIKHEAHQLHVQCTLRILQQAPDGIDVGDLDYFVRGGLSIGSLARGPGTGDNILLTWPVNEGCDWDDNRTRVYLYKMALASVADGIARRHQAFCTAFCVRLLATRFQSFFELGIHNLHEVVFHASRRHELMERGILQQIPVRTLNFPRTVWDVWLQFRYPASPATHVSDPWNPSCEHRRKGEWAKAKDQAWSTGFGLHRETVLAGCKFCSHRLELQLERWKTQFPEHPVSVLFTSAGIGFVELKFVDLEDGKSEWKYWLLHEFSEEERKRLGSIV